MLTLMLHNSKYIKSLSKDAGKDYETCCWSRTYIVVQHYSYKALMEFKPVCYQKANHSNKWW